MVYSAKWSTVPNSLQCQMVYSAAWQLGAAGCKRVLGPYTPRVALPFDSETRRAPCPPSGTRLLQARLRSKRQMLFRTSKQKAVFGSGARAASPWQEDNSASTAQRRAPPLGLELSASAPATLPRESSKPTGLEHAASRQCPRLFLCVFLPC
ncbi:unnamed protein product [Prorocentrum cordatum]|uniref:Uncharacterized protein n=1 Tax=Prorocentrum cordatum TaxID=2364126 RepID=A0ABN9XWR8_9DINO|nr:unnamed protein product [Polarella glacialis]